MLFSLAWSAKLCPTYQVIITLHNSPSSMAKDTSLLETATPWHSADVFTWYFWRQSDAHFRLRAIASHDTEKRDDDADWYRYVYWMLLIYHPIPVSHIYILCPIRILTKLWTFTPFWMQNCIVFFVSHTRRVWVETSNQDISGPWKISRPVWVNVPIIISIS